MNNLSCFGKFETLIDCKMCKTRASCSREMKRLRNEEIKDEKKRELANEYETLEGENE